MRKFYNLHPVLRNRSRSFALLKHSRKSSRVKTVPTLFKRLSWKLRPRFIRDNEGKRIICLPYAQYHFKPYTKTVRGILRFGKLRNKKPERKSIDYGRRWKLIVGPRIESNNRLHPFTFGG